MVNEVSTPYEGDMPYMNTADTDVFKIPEDQLYVFEKIYDLCQKEGIKLVLYSVPSPHCYDMRQHNAYAKLAQEHGIDYLDGNVDIEKIGIDMATDYFDDDGDHLNLCGTRKMTVYLGDYLRDNCDLEDHRDDPAYRSWADQLTDYEEEQAG